MVRFKYTYSATNINSYNLLHIEFKYLKRKFALVVIEPKRSENYGKQPYTWLTITISALVLVTSSAGIFIKDTYAKESTSWALQATGQDIANIASIPILLVSAYYANSNNSKNNKELSKGLMVWIGVLLFINYAYAIYAFDVHNSLFLFYVGIFGVILLHPLRQIDSP